MTSAATARAAACEKIPTCIFATAADVNVAVAREIAALIRQRAAEGKNAVLGLATGSTPTGVYNELVRMHQQEGLSFGNVVTFNLDEYYPIQRHELQSYHRFMHEWLFDHVDIPPENVHIPDGAVAIEQRGRVLRGLRKGHRRRGRNRRPDPRHRPQRAHRLQRTGVLAPQPHATDHAGPRNPRRCRQRFLRPRARSAAGDHHGRRHDPCGPQGDPRQLRRTQGRRAGPGHRGAGHQHRGRQLLAGAS